MTHNHPPAHATTPQPDENAFRRGLAAETLTEAHRGDVGALDLMLAARTRRRWHRSMWRRG